LDLLRYVRHNPVRSVRSLAVDLHRDYKNVHQDVEALAKIGLLARTTESVTAPFAEVDVRFVL